MLDSTMVLLLCRNKHNYVTSLNKELLKHNIKSTIIVDNLRLDPTYNGLCHIGALVNNRFKSTAWDNAFYYIFNTYLDSNIKYFYFIEDDVYSKNLHTFIHLIHYYLNNNYDLISRQIFSQKESRDWFWWHNDADVISFDEPYKSFNPLCRMSSGLVYKIYEHHSKYRRFLYNEFLFASLAKKNQLTCLDYDKEQNPFIGNIRYRPCFKKSLIKDDKIYHPVKQS